MNEAFNYYKQYMEKRDLVLEGYLKRIRARNPKAKVIIVRSHWDSGFPIKLSEREGSEDVRLMWPERRSVELDQMGELLQSDWYLENLPMNQKMELKFEYTQEQKDTMLLRNLISGLIGSTYDITRELKTLKYTLRKVTDRLTLQDIQYLCDYISSNLASDEEYNDNIRLLNKTKSQATISRLSPKVEKTKIGYVMKWLQDNKFLTDEELPFFPEINIYTQYAKVNILDNTKSEFEEFDQAA